MVVREGTIAEAIATRVKRLCAERGMTQDALVTAAREQGYEGHTGSIGRLWRGEAKFMPEERTLAPVAAVFAETVEEFVRLALVEFHEPPNPGYVDSPHGLGRPPEELEEAA